MRITPIIYRPNIIRKTNSSNNCRYSQAEGLRAPSPIMPVQFRRSAKNAEVLRELMAYKIPDMYSGKILLNPKDLEHLISSHVFSGPISKIIEAVEPYRNCLHTVESQVFSIIKSAATKRPQAKLAEIIEDIAPIHYTRLRNIQTPYFKELDALSTEMPEDTRKKYKELMSITESKLKNEPVWQPFSAKEFNYKLKRIAEEIEAGNNIEEITVINTMRHLASKMPEKTPEELDTIKNLSSKVVRNRKLRNQQALVRQRNELLKQIEVLQMNSPLNNNFELSRLLQQTRAKIFNIPTKTSFNRKSFIYELKKITDTLKDTKLARQMIKTATLLPTSHDDLSAFIVKASDYSSSKIGYNLLASAEGSIEHLIPYNKNGLDLLSNYGLASTYYNSERADKSMAQYLRQHPEAYKNSQKQINRLIELYKDGTFEKIGLSKWYIINFAQQMYKLSPPEKRMVLDLGELMHE